MYCSLTEAWPDIDYNTLNTNKTRSEYEHSNVERFNQIPLINKSFETESRPELVNRVYSDINRQQHTPKKINQVNQQVISLPVDTQKFVTCDTLLSHLDECEECRIYVTNKLNRSNRLANLFETNPQLKETIMVFLIGILILMILNLFYK